MNSAMRLLRPYLRALLVGAGLGYFVVLGFARYYTPDEVLAGTYMARFEWDSPRGVKMFRLEDSALGSRGAEVFGSIWSPFKPSRPCTPT